VRDEPIELHEGAFVEEHVEALARRELSLVVLRLDTLSASALLGFGASPLEQVELFTHCHRARKLTELSAIRYQLSAKRKPSGRFSWREKHPEGSELIADS
jgi:hypothetical protein